MLAPSGRANKTGGYRLGLMNCLLSLRAAKAQLGQIRRSEWKPERTTLLRFALY